MIEKIAKILNQAMNASTPEEADAFLSAAQALSTKYSIDLAIARQHTAKDERVEVIEKRTVSLDFGKVSDRKHLVNLYLAIARNNDVRIDIAHNSRAVIPYGYESDLDVVEALFVHLAAQMIETANAYLATGEYKEETERRTVRFKNFTGYYGEYYDRAKGEYYDWDYKVVDKAIDGRVARSNFYTSFVNSVKARLDTARRNAETEAITTTTGSELALVDKREEVHSYYKGTSNAKGSWRGVSTSGYSRSAHTAGRRAGDNARLTSQGAVSGGRAAINA